MAFNRAQKKALFTGLGIILAAAAFVVLIWVGTYLPGFAGEIFSIVAGMMWTPIILDVSLFLIGLVLILSLNSFLRARDGDEFVYLEQVEGPDIPADMPGAARSAIFAEEPEPQGLDPALAAIEGAFELGDHEEAATLLYELPPECLEEPEVLPLRIRLARARGDDDKARALEDLLDTISQSRRRGGRPRDSAGE